MPRFQITNNGKKTFGMVNPRDPKGKERFPFTWGTYVSVLLSPGKSCEIAGVGADIAADQIPGIAEKLGFEPNQIVIKELEDLEQAGGEPVWIVVVKKDAAKPEPTTEDPNNTRVLKWNDDPDKSDWPFGANAAGKTWMLKPGSNEMTEFAAMGIELAYAWLVEETLSKAEWDARQNAPKEPKVK